MGKRRILVVLGVLLALAACSDVTGPPADTSLPNDIALLASVAGDNGSGVEPHILEAGSGLQLDKYRASFWVTGRRGGWVRIRYLEAGGDDDDDDDGDDDDDDDGDVTEDTFLLLYVPKGAIDRLPNGKKFRKRDKVLVTATVDPDLLLVSLEPELRFKRKRPAWLYLSYAGADGDFDKDGDQDWVDQIVEENHLGIWTREGEGARWFPQAATRALSKRSFLARLRHFSDYAISW